MKSYNALRLLIVLIFSSALIGCKKDKDNTGNNIGAIGSSKDKLGLGDNTGTPEGADLQLPPCIQIVDRPNYRFNSNETKVYGSSQAFYVPISFINNCSSGATVEIPDGLVLISEYQEGQNGLIVERVRINVPPTDVPGGVKDTTTIYLAVNCLNENRTPPVSRYSADYNIGDFGYKVGKVTNDANLLKFLKLLEGKTGLRVSGFILNDPELPAEDPELHKMYSEIQAAIWKITDGNGLTASEVKELQVMLKEFE